MSGTIQTSLPGISVLLTDIAPEPSMMLTTE